MVKWQIVWIKIIDEVDMLHAKIYYNLLPLIGNNSPQFCTSLVPDSYFRSEGVLINISGMTWIIDWLI
jgi:hypothetical protein